MRMILTDFQILIKKIIFNKNQKDMKIMLKLYNIINIFYYFMLSSFLEENFHYYFKINTNF